MNGSERQNVDGVHQRTRLACIGVAAARRIGTEARARKIVPALCLRVSSRSRKPESTVSRKPTSFVDHHLVALSAAGSSDSISSPPPHRSLSARTHLPIPLLLVVSHSRLRDHESA